MCDSVKPNKPDQAHMTLGNRLVTAGAQGLGMGEMHEVGGGGS